MSKLISEHDKQMEVYETKKMHTDETNQTNDLQKFLGDGLDAKNVFIFIDYVSKSLFLYR